MRKNSQFPPGHHIVGILTVAVLLLVAQTLGSTQPNGRRPFSKKALSDVLYLNLLPSQELINQVEQRGVDFQLTSGIETELRQAQASVRLIEGVRANYRPALTAPDAARITSSNSLLNKRDILMLVQSGQSSAAIAQLAEARGVDFLLTPETVEEITKAGGTRELLGVLSLSVKSNRALYDDLIDLALAKLREHALTSAQDLLQRAIKTDQSMPIAYALLTYLQFRSRRIVFSESGQAAIERGGWLPYRVKHSHSAITYAHCVGTLFVSKSSMIFNSDDSRHTFEFTDPDSLKVGGNLLEGINIKAAQLGGKKHKFVFLN